MAKSADVTWEASKRRQRKRVTKGRSTRKQDKFKGHRVGGLYTQNRQVGTIAKNLNMK